MGEVREIDHHAQPVHLADHVLPERRETAVAGGFGLDVPQLVDAVVHELDRSKPALVRLLDARDLAFEEVTTFGGEHRARAAPAQHPPSPRAD